MTPKHSDTAANSLHTILLGCALVGLAVSALLVGEYRTGGVLCSAGGGCDLVRASAYSSIGWVSVPVLGVLYFAALLVAAALPRLRAVRVPLALLGAAAGLVFVGIQAFVIGAFCQFCLVVDAASIAAGLVAWKGRDAETPPLTLERAGILAILAVASVGMAGVSQWFVEPATSVVEQTPEQLPGAVAREQKAAGPVTVVEYIDFQCPACRYQYQVFKEVLADVPYDVRMVYMHSPLPQHEMADGAARAYICVEDSEVAKPFADRLFTDDDITVPAIEALAGELGLDVAELRRCMDSETTSARLDRDLKLASQVGVQSLPTFWIGRQKFVGTSDPATVRKSLDRWVRIPADQ